MSEPHHGSRGDSATGGDAAGAADAPPRASRDDLVRWGATLQGMARLRSLLIHDLRSRVQGLSLQTDLVAELGRSGAGIPDESRARLARYANALHAEVIEIYEASEATLRMLQVDELAVAAEDAATLMHDLDCILTPLARQRRVRLALVPPAEPIVPAAATALRHASLLLLVEALVRCPAEGEVRWSVEPADADLAFTLAVPDDLARALVERLETAPEPGSAADLGNAFTAVRSALHAASARVSAVGESPSRLVVRWPRGR